MHDLLIEQICSWVITSRGIWLEPVTQIATRNERYRPTRVIDRFTNAATEFQMIVNGKKTVTECNDFAAPSVPQQKIKWHSCTVVQFCIRDLVNHIVACGSMLCNCIQ